MALYKDLAGGHATIENETDDIRINSRATNAQLEWTRQGYLLQNKKPGREDLEAFETSYNAACSSIARGELGQGEVLLKRAKGEYDPCDLEGYTHKSLSDLCNALDELTADEKTAELLPISVQQLYVLTKLGNIEEAEAVASEIAIEQCVSGIYDGPVKPF